MPHLPCEGSWLHSITAPDLERGQRPVRPGCTTQTNSLWGGGVGGGGDTRPS